MAIGYCVEITLALIFPNTPSHAGLRVTYLILILYSLQSTLSHFFPHMKLAAEKGIIHGREVLWYGWVLQSLFH